MQQVAAELKHSETVFVRQEAEGVRLRYFTPAGEVELQEGVIIAKRHLHVLEADAEKMGIKNGEIIRVACGGEGRKLIFDDVVVRVNTDGATTMHIDTDEAQAAGGPTEGEIFRV